MKNAFVALKSNWFKVGIVIAIILISGTVMYYLNLKKSEEARAETLECMVNRTKQFLANMKLSCLINGANKNDFCTNMTINEADGFGKYSSVVDPKSEYGLLYNDFQIDLDKCKN